MINKIKVKGKAVAIEPACKALNASAPPTYNNAIATEPSANAQKTLCTTGASSFPPAVILSITSEPESDDVTKNTITKNIAIKDVKSENGRFSNIWNIAKDLSEIPFAKAPTSPITWLRAVSPKVLIHTAVTKVGTNKTAMINSRTVRPLEILAINIPTKGDHAIHHAQ